MTAVAAAAAGLEDDVLSLEASSMSEEESDDTEQGNAVTSSGSVEWHFTPADAPLLVRLVKMCQKVGYGGLRGTWKDYLKVLPTHRSQQPAASCCHCCILPDAQAVLLVQHVQQTPCQCRACRSQQLRTLPATRGTC